VVKKVSEYLKHAKEWRMLAASGKAEHRAMLLQMAETWESLARDREEQVARLKRLASLLPQDN
jgi:hypothetical protein